ncbi:MAG: hypothetical protein B6D45_09220 [Ignavibacteriales bacterium UTCHB3]|nr:MAG: hypothetical protein B6D45_09220 [Ignavibacteriales bacterium UTCHB3]
MPKARGGSRLKGKCGFFRLSAKREITRFAQTDFPFYAPNLQNLFHTFPYADPIPNLLPLI